MMVIEKMASALASFAKRVRGGAEARRRAAGESEGGGGTCARCPFACGREAALNADVRGVASFFFFNKPARLRVLLVERASLTSAK